MINVAVIGAGHFGREHARIYAAAEDVRLVAICDPNERAALPVAQQFGTTPVSDFREVLGKVDAVSLAVPTEHHQALACPLLEAGVGVLVEKPIARTVAEADLIIESAKRSGAVLQVGHLERFNPAVVAVSEIVTRPLFFEAHRLSVFTPRSLDIDVVMDLMVHDIDVVLSLVRSEPVDIRAAGVPILTPRIDIANARVEFAGGCVANLTASRVSSERVRKVRFFQPHEYVSIDYTAQEAQVVSVVQTSEGRPDFTARRLATQHEEPLRLEIESFLAAVKGAPVKVTGADGRRALALALEITQTIRDHALRAGVPYQG